MMVLGIIEMVIGGASAIGSVAYIVYFLNKIF